MYTEFYSGNLNGTHHLEDLGVDEEKILKPILQQIIHESNMAECCEDHNKTSAYIKPVEFLD
jgi:hypothetical protein